MAITTFIPELWSARLIHALDKALVGKNFINRNYEGEIKNQGDTVHINTIGAITIGNYTRNTDFANGPETLTTVPTDLKITESKMFNFQVDDVDKVQAAGELVDVAMGRAAYGLADEADTFIFATIVSGVNSGNVVTATTDAYKDAVGLRNKLDKANVPLQGRKMAVTPDYYAELLQDKHFVEASDAANAIAQNGVVGYISGMAVYITNNLPSGTKAMATVVEATTYADQISEVEAYRPEKRFADAVKGLHLYGAQVVYDTAIAVLQ